MKNKNKKTKIYFIIVIIVLLSVSIGYSILSTTLSIESNITVSGKSLYNKIAKQAVMDNTKSTYVSSSTGIDFSMASGQENGRGVYELSSTKSDKFPIYYYRGIVKNNNVSFANFCWKIVRTTDTGGIKLIYNGRPSNGKCNNTTGTGTQIGTSKFNVSTGTPADVGYMYGDISQKFYEMGETAGANIYYGTSLTVGSPSKLSGTTYHATTTWKNYYQQLTANGYYTCNVNNLYCSTGYNGVSYIYSKAENGYWYIDLQLTGLSNALRKMTYDASNTNDSTIKKYIDSWYSAFMSSYTSKLEDTGWCNDRNISSYTGWKENAADFAGNVTFTAGNRNSEEYTPSVTCPKKNDNFTVSNTTGNAKLTYPVGLITADEATLAGINDSDYFELNNYLNNGTSWWTMSFAKYTNALSDYTFPNAVLGYQVSSYYLDHSVNDNELGVRPSVSLKPDTKISSGDGTAEKPYVIA